MLKVKTYLDKSPINGIGLFADEVINKGTIIWNYDPYFDKKFHENEIQFFDKIIEAYLLKYTYKDGKMFVLCCDNAKYMNHSLTPNTVNGIGDTTIASRDIKVGEELTCNYYEIDDDVNSKLKYIAG